MHKRINNFLTLRLLDLTWYTPPKSELVLERRWPGWHEASRGAEFSADVEALDGTWSPSTLRRSDPVDSGKRNSKVASKSVNWIFSSASWNRKLGSLLTLGDPSRAASTFETRLSTSERKLATEFSSGTPVSFTCTPHASEVTDASFITLTESLRERMPSACSLAKHRSFWARSRQDSWSRIELDSWPTVVVFISWGEFELALRLSRNSFKSHNFSRRAIVSTRLLCGGSTTCPGSEEHDFRAGVDFLLALLPRGGMGGLSVENRPGRCPPSAGELDRGRDEVDDRAAVEPRAGDGDRERSESLGKEKSSLLWGIVSESSRLARGEGERGFLLSLPAPSLYKCRNLFSDACALGSCCTSARLRDGRAGDAEWCEMDTATTAALCCASPQWLRHNPMSGCQSIPRLSITRNLTTLATRSMQIHPATNNSIYIDKSKPKFKQPGGSNAPWTPPGTQFNRTEPSAPNTLHTHTNPPLTHTLHENKKKVVMPAWNYHPLVQPALNNEFQLVVHLFQRSIIDRELQFLTPPSPRATWSTVWKKTDANWRQTDR